MGQVLHASAIVKEHSAISRTLRPEAKDGGEVQEQGSCLRCADGTEESASYRTEY